MWETPTKTSKCISFRDAERESGQERIQTAPLAWSANLANPQKGGVLNPGFLNSPFACDRGALDFGELFALVSRTLFSTATPPPTPTPWGEQGLEAELSGELGLLYSLSVTKRLFLYYDILLL